MLKRKLLVLIKKKRICSTVQTSSKKGSVISSKISNFGEVPSASAAYFYSYHFEFLLLNFSIFPNILLLDYLNLMNVRMSS